MLKVDVVRSDPNWSILAVETPSGKKIAVEFTATSLGTFDTNIPLSVFTTCNMVADEWLPPL